jgi:hypothetical protein
MKASLLRGIRANRIKPYEYPSVALMQPEGNMAPATPAVAQQPLGRVDLYQNT